MASEKKKQTLYHLTKQYKLNVLASADAASLNLVGALAATCVLIVGAIVNRIFLGSWTDLNVYLALFTGLIAAICFFGIKIANQWNRAVPNSPFTFYLIHNVASNSNPAEKTPQHLTLIKITIYLLTILR